MTRQAFNALAGAIALSIATAQGATVGGVRLTRIHHDQMLLRDRQHAGFGSLLFDVKPVDPSTYAAVSIGLIAAALAASYVPALRAASVDPVDALRAE